jgi:hypothetical protein
MHIFASMATESTHTGTDTFPYGIDCRRSYLHRYIPADGVWVGLNGHGKFILNFYNDTPPLPKIITLESQADRKAFTSKPPDILLETNLESVRQFEVSVNLSLASVKRLIETLQNFVTLADGGDKPTAEK